MFDRHARVARALNKMLSPLEKQGSGASWQSEQLHPSGHPFGMVVAGANLLSHYTFGEAFPARDKRTAKRGAEALLKALPTERGRRAAVFLAFGLGAYAHENEFRRGHTDLAALADSALAELNGLWPLNADELRRLHAARAEYETLLGGEPRPGVVSNGFHAALLRGEDPREDDSLVTMQSAWAAKYLFHEATLSAIEIAVGPQAFDEFRSEIVPSDAPLGSAFEHVRYLERDVHFWLIYVPTWWSCVGIQASDAAVAP